VIRDKVIAALNDPAKAGDLKEEELTEIIAHAPYFTPALLWLSQLKHQKGRLDYETSLAKAAAVALDREHLYNLIYKQPLREKIEAVQELTKEEDTLASQETAPKQEEVPLDGLPVDAKVEEGIPLTKVGDKTRKPEELDELELEILKHAAASAPILTDSATKVPQQEEPEKPEGIPEITVGKRQFSEWLKVIDGRPIEKKEKPAAQPKVRKEDLINRFIAQEPQISKSSKSEFFKPSKMAKLSLVENNDFVTETLAKIYEQQGNKQKAITIYKKLMLTYPEKKNYFAARISALEGAKKD
jgi:tetratricopeptide (TPR) repeat protein